MINRFSYDGITWVDLEAPNADELSEIASEFKLDELIVQELATPTAKPKVDLRHSFLYAVLHFPAFRHTHTGDADQEIDFVIGKKFIITTRYETVDPILDFQRSFEAAALAGKKGRGLNGGHLFFEMMRRLYHFTENELDDIDDALARVEAEIFAGREREMVTEISQLSRKLLDVRRILSPHRSVLDSFEHAGGTFFEEDFSHYARAISAEHSRVFERTNGSLDLVAQLRATNDSLVTTKQNETMKLLTLMTFVTAPLTLLAGLFGMNLKHLPFIDDQNGFWFIIGCMLVISAGFLVFFKRKGWL